MNTELPPDEPPGQGIRKPEPDRRHTAAQARFHVTLGVLRAALEEQPSAATVRAAGRRWINAAAVLTEEVAKAVQKKRKEGGK